MVYTSYNCDWGFDIEKINDLPIYHLLKNFDFKEDPVILTSYLLKRLYYHGINNVLKWTILDFVSYNNLLVAQSISIDVEKSFCILETILRVFRYFTYINIWDYILEYYNNNTDS